ncbi:MAG: DUF3168 domain-containing protein [Roseibium sp.]
MSFEIQILLRSALFSVLSADLTLEFLLGTGRIFDTPPRGQSYPYLVLDTLESRPLLADPGLGLIHDLTLSAFSREQSRDQAVHAASRSAEVLMNGPVPLTGHRLVNLTVTNVVSRRLRDGRGFRATCALRAVTEPLS